MSVKPRDNPNNVLNSLEMASDKAHIPLNSFIQVGLLSFLPLIQKVIDLTWLILRQNAKGQVVVVNGSSFSRCFQSETNVIRILGLYLPPI
jgi:hypothetical protein